MFYLDLFAALQRHRVRYLLVGGLAMNLHGVPRLTMDVDIVLALDSVNLKNFFAVAQEFRLKPSLPVALADLADPATRESWVKQRNMIAFPLQGPDKTNPALDILIGVSFEFDAAYARCIRQDVSGVEVMLAGIDDMITLKEQADRPQDWADIEQLERLRESR